MTPGDSEKVWLAALLHDIGKFEQRAKWGSYTPHHEYGAQWCECDYFRYAFGSDIAQGVHQHHNRRLERSNEARLRLVQIVQLADKLAAGERAKAVREQEDPQRSGLISIFSRIPLHWNDQNEAGDYPPE